MLASPARNRTCYGSFVTKVRSVTAINNFIIASLTSQELFSS